MNTRKNKKIERKVNIYYEFNHARLEKFAYDVVFDRFMNMGHFIKLNFTEYVKSTRFEYPDTIHVNIKNICRDFIQLNPNMSNEEYDNLIRARLLFGITKEKFCSVAFTPFRSYYHEIQFQLRDMYTKRSSVCIKETYKYISTHTVLLSEIFNIPYDIIYNINMIYGYKYSLSCEKFKKCSQYTDFKLLIRYFTDIDSSIILDKEFERKYMGYNYRLSYINVKTTDGKIVRIKNGVHWFYDNINSLFKTMDQSDLRIFDIEYGYINI